MSSISTDEIFEQHIYVTREIDNELGVFLEAFIRGQRPMRWICLKAAQGSGRTLLLERLRRLKADATNRDVLRVFVSGQSSRVSSLNPLAAELYALHLSAQKSVSGWVHSTARDIKRRLSNSGWRQIFVTLLIVAAGLSLASLLGGFNEFVTSSEANLSSLHGWLAFFVTFLPNNWAKLPLWLLTGSVTGVPLSLIVVYLTRNKLLPAPPEVDTPTSVQITEFTSHEGLKRSLFDLFAKRKRILLLVDDIFLLPALEQHFLQDIFVPETRELFQKKGWQLMIVTVDNPEFEREQALDKQMAPYVEVVQAPNFELIELQDIVDKQLPAAANQSQEERLSLLEQGRADVNALFAAQNQQLIREVGDSFQANDIDGEFTPAMLLAYRLARRDQSITKKALIKWLNRFRGEDHLRIFDISNSESDQALVINLAKSDLVKRRGETIVFDAKRSEALRQWLKQNNPELLQQTQYYWFKSALGQVNAAKIDGEIGMLPKEEIQKLRLGSGHAIQLNTLKAVPQVLTNAPGVTGNELNLRCEEAARLLIPAIALARSEGDFEKSDTLAWNALEWLHSGDATQRVAQVEWISKQLWRSFLRSGDPETRKKIDGLGENLPELAAKPWWAVYTAIDDWRKGRTAVAPLPPEDALLDPDHRNLHRLTRVLQDVKQNYGFLSSAFADPAFEIPPPESGGSQLFAELELRALLAAALNQRNERERLLQVLEAWRERLLEISPPEELLGDRAVHLYHRARYWHVLTDVWESAGTRGEVLSDEEHEMSPEERSLEEAKLAEQLKALFLPTPAPLEVSTPALSSEAEKVYEQTRRLLVLLGWQALLIEASFHLGVLLATYRGEEENPEKWEWDMLFAQVLQLEAKFGWLIHAPEAHKIRWGRVYLLDRELSIEDAFNVYQSMIKAGFPTAQIVEWHQRTGQLLNDYGREDEDRERSAQLHEEWARTWAHNPAAQSVWRYAKLVYEQAHALIFAAQAKRWLQQFEAAEKLLDEAESLLNSAAETETEDHDDSQVRELRITIQLQRAWLLDDQDKVNDYREMIREIWRRLSFADSVTSNVLGSLLRIETAEKLLDKPWPQQDQPVYLDPDNPSLSLPADWFNSELALPVNNRFEFRFRQLLHLVSNEAVPSSRGLYVAAAGHWWGREKFAEVTLQFVQTALQQGLSPELEPLLLSLLQTVRTYFRQIEGLDRRELETLRLLMNYHAAAGKYRDDYIKVLVEFESLVEREKRVREMSESLHWTSVARWAWAHLWLLASDTLIKQYLMAHHQTIDLFVSRRDQLVQHLNEASRHYQSGQFADCLLKLEKIPFPGPGQFVLIEDIIALDLWLRCKQKSGETRTEEFNERAAQLRGAVIEYVQQFSAIISEHQVQILALNILSDLKQVETRLLAPQQN